MFQVCCCFNRRTETWISLRWANVTWYEEWLRRFVLLLFVNFGCTWSRWQKIKRGKDFRFFCRLVVQKNCKKRRRSFGEKNWTCLPSCLPEKHTGGVLFFTFKILFIILHEKTTFLPTFLCIRISKEGQEKQKSKEKFSKHIRILIMENINFISELTLQYGICEPFVRSSTFELCQFDVPVHVYFNF